MYRGMIYAVRGLATVARRVGWTGRGRGDGQGEGRGEGSEPGSEPGTGAGRKPTGHNPCHPICSLLQVVERQLVAEHLPAILERGFAALMEAHRVDDVARLYSLAARVGAVETLRTAFREFVRAAGLRLVKDEEKVRRGLPACGGDASHTVVHCPPEESAAVCLLVFLDMVCTLSHPWDVLPSRVAEPRHFPKPLP